MHLCTRCTFKHSNTKTHNMVSLYTSQRICRQSLNRVQRHTHLCRTLLPASYPWRHTHMLTHKTSKLNSRPAHSLSLELLELLEVLELLLFIFIIKRNIILWLGFSNLSTKATSIFLRYPVSCITLCFAYWENMCNLPCPGPLLIMIKPFFTFSCLFTVFWNVIPGLTTLIFNCRPRWNSFKSI